MQEGNDIEIKETLGIRLRRVMRKQRVSAVTLSRISGCSRNRIGAILRDEQTPDYFTMKAIRKTLGIDPKEALSVFFPEYK